MAIKTLTEARDDSKSRKIIMAVDFGTTYSGLAWCQTARPETKDCIIQWPDANGSLQGKTQEKVPTELLYKNGQMKWGFQISDEEERHLWFKLGLDPKQPDSISHLSLEYPDPKALPPDYINDPVKLATDYLTCLCKHAYEILRLKLGRGVVDTTPLEFIITVPAIWDDAAKDRTAACATAAGMGEKVRIITEPESAVVYTLDNMDPHDLQVGDSFVLCDAGGGTVDLISYDIEELTPRVKVREAVAGGGDPCGSTFLNRIFGRYLESNYGDHEDWDEEIMEEAMKSFESAKREFNSKSKNIVILVPGLPDDAARGLRRGRLTIPAAKVKELFQPVMAMITTLVRKQLKQTKNAKAVLLVGGFGRSVYLRECIEKVVGPTIEVLQPADAWVAVVKGALIWALDESTGEAARINIASRKARKYYGMSGNTPYDPTIHEATRRFWDGFTGCNRIKTMTWFLGKGEDVDPTKPVVTEWYQHKAVTSGPFQSATVKLFSFSPSDDGEAPLYPSKETKKLLDLTADLSAISRSLIPIERGADGIDYYVVRHQIKAAFYSAHTEYSLWYKGMEYGKVKAEYA